MYECGFENGFENGGNPIFKFSDAQILIIGPSPVPFTFPFATKSYFFTKMTIMVHQCCAIFEFSTNLFSLLINLFKGILKRSITRWSARNSIQILVKNRIQSSVTKQPKNGAHLRRHFLPSGNTLYTTHLMSSFRYVISNILVKHFFLYLHRVSGTPTRNRPN